MEAKYGVEKLHEFLQSENLYDGEHRALTESEARTLLRAGTLDAARDRIFEAGRESLREAQPGIFSEALPPTRAQVRTARGLDQPGGVNFSAAAAEWTVDEPRLREYIQSRGINEDGAKILRSQIAEVSGASGVSYIHREAEDGQGIFAFDAPAGTGTGAAAQSGLELDAPILPAPDVSQEALAARKMAFAYPHSATAWLMAFDHGDTVSSIMGQYFKGTLDVAPLLGCKVNSPRDFAALLMPLRSPYVESFKVAYLDDSARLLDLRVLSIGHLGESTIWPPEILRTMPAGCKGAGSGVTH